MRKNTLHNTLNDRHEIHNPYKAKCSECKCNFNSSLFICNKYPSEIPDDILAGERTCPHFSPIKNRENGF